MAKKTDKKEVKEVEKDVAKGVTISLNLIKPNPNNPRSIKGGKLAKLKQSISEFPQMMESRPIVVDEEFVILGGNMRLNALKSLKYKEVPENWIRQVIGWTDKQKKEFVVKDNLSYGEWDFDILIKEWSSEALLDWGMDLPDDKMNINQIGEKYNDNNCEYPLIPVFDEKYEAIIIVTETKTEMAAVKTRLGITQKRKSYKNSFLGETNIITGKDFLKHEEDNSKS